mgnify:CR=1 FL=1
MLEKFEVPHTTLYTYSFQSPVPAVEVSQRLEPPVPMLLEAQQILRPAGILAMIRATSTLARAASRSEIESPVAGAGRTLGLYLQYVLAVIGGGRVLLPGNRHHAVTGIVVDGSAVVPFPESGVTVKHLAERHGRGEFLGGRNTGRPLCRHGRGEGDGTGSVP